MAFNPNINDTPTTVMMGSYGRLDNDPNFPSVSATFSDNIGTQNVTAIYPKYAQLVYNVSQAATQGRSISAVGPFTFFNVNQAIIANPAATLTHVDVTLTSGLCCQIWVNPTSTTTTYLAVSGINVLNSCAVTLLGA